MKTAEKGRSFRAVLAFRTTTDAMAMEDHCLSHHVPGRLIPLPSVIAAGCGLCFSTPWEERESAVSAAEAAGVVPEGLYQMLL